MPSPHGLILVGDAVLTVCSAVVLGISAYVEHTTRKIGYHSSTYTYDAFVGAFTILVVLGFIVARLAKPGLATVLNETAVAGLTWIFWLAAAISTTHTSRDDRAVCRHLDDLFDLPEFENVDKDALALAKKIFKSTCRDLNAQLAFIWIGFIVVTFILGYLIYLGTKRSNTMWRATLRGYDKDLHTHQDPFADPVGSTQGPVAGVADERAVRV
ncbi:hypothetical protein I316_05439 [Kwoniella heveanensis BCC8398]|uniref:MARVEL domain-containing protein n=1 Tax=Kwoniella heveanensis BCC8398 TaxID=1296120 RepID=A0A1B9GP72_9TREE|nr:hypothetical protein I316_05439 [Kwoniella heveanensis BCC8398]